jgi:hypothetical protein
MHGTVSQTCFAIAAAAPLVLLLGAPQGVLPRPHRWLWLTAGVAGVAIEVFGVTMRAGLNLPEGIFQRPFTLVFTAWFLGAAAWLLRSPGRMAELAEITR